jgi:hypothetical protein
MLTYCIDSKTPIENNKLHVKKTKKIYKDKIIFTMYFNYDYDDKNMEKLSFLCITNNIFKKYENDDKTFDIYYTLSNIFFLKNNLAHCVEKLNLATINYNDISHASQQLNKPNEKYIMDDKMLSVVKNNLHQKILSLKSARINIKMDYCNPYVYDHNSKKYIKVNMSIFNENYVNQFNDVALIVTPRITFTLKNNNSVTPSNTDVKNTSSTIEHNNMTFDNCCVNYMITSLYFNKSLCASNQISLCSKMQSLSV